MSDFLCWLHPSRPLAPGQLPLSLDRIAVDDDGGWGLAGMGAAFEDGVLAAIRGHPQWRDPALAETAAERGHAAALTAAWRDHGDGFIDRLGGDFALVVADPATGRLYAAIDRMGQESLCLLRHGDGIAVATRAGLLARHPAADTCIEPRAVHDYLHFHMIPAPATAFSGVDKLAAAHRVELRDGVVTQARYWTPAFLEEPIDAQALGEELHDTLRAAVERRLVAGTGSFLSGGLDSSTVTGLHGRLRPEEAHAFSIGFDAPGYDEIPFARLSAAHFGVPLTEYYVTQHDIADTVERVVQAFDEPFGNSSALPAFFCARLAREHGMVRLLAGDGGDELFAGNARYRKQAVFEHYFRLPGLVRRGLLEPLLTSPLGALPGVRKARSYVTQARIPLPDRLESYNFLHRIDPAEMFEPGFLAALDPERPLQRLRETYRVPADATTLNRMLYLDWQLTLADNDLRKVAGACRLAGIDVVYPMLDDDVVALSCRVPSALKLRGAELRHFYKQSFRGFLPEAVIDKRKHGFGLPFGVWLRDDPRLHQLAGDMLQTLQGRGWVRDSFLDRLLDVQLRDHPAYYGELVWILMALGIWLQRPPD